MDRAMQNEQPWMQLTRLMGLGLALSVGSGLTVAAVMLSLATVFSW